MLSVQKNASARITHITYKMQLVSRANQNFVMLNLSETKNSLCGFHRQIGMSLLWINITKDHKFTPTCKKICVTVFAVFPSANTGESVAGRDY